MDTKFTISPFDNDDIGNTHRALEADILSSYAEKIFNFWMQKDDEPPSQSEIEQILEEDMLSSARLGEISKALTNSVKNDHPWPTTEELTLSLRHAGSNSLILVIEGAEHPYILEVSRWSENSGFLSASNDNLVYFTQLSEDHCKAPWAHQYIKIPKVYSLRELSINDRYYYSLITEYLEGWDRLDITVNEQSNRPLFATSSTVSQESTVLSDHLLELQRTWYKAFAALTFMTEGYPPETSTYVGDWLFRQNNGSFDIALCSTPIQFDLESLSENQMLDNASLKNYVQQQQVGVGNNSGYEFISVQDLLGPDDVTQSYLIQEVLNAYKSSREA